MHLLIESKVLLKKSFFNWSSGKDSALALYKILQKKEFYVDKLLTNINKDFSRISMHGLRENILDKQVENIGLSLNKLYFPADVTMDLYNQKMKERLIILKNEGYKYSVFGDIFLEERAYRDYKLAEINLKGVYPLWKQDTKEVLKEFLDLGFKAITVCVNARLLGKEFVGRIIDEQFIKDLPDNVDVCGENGEFHTFVFDGPIFKFPVDFTVGDKVLKSYTFKNDDDNDYHKKNIKKENYDNSFWYCDLL